MRNKMKLLSARKTIDSPQGELCYTLRRHRRAKRLKVTVRCDASVVVTLPTWASARYVEPFLLEKAPWLARSIRTMAARPPAAKPGGSREEYLECKSAALALVLERLAVCNRSYGLKYRTVTIRNQATRWGSCSARGNLSFNYKVAALPPALRDYVIVHELCHLGEHNHSSRFWKLVERTIPDHKLIRSELRRVRPR